MKLVAVERSDLALGRPLAWMIYDRNGNVLLEAGAIVEGGEDLDALLALEPMRNTEEGLSSAVVPTQEEQKSYSFADMRLRVGDRLQIEPPPTVSSERHMVKVIGWVENQSLLVTTPMVNGLRVPLRDNDKIVARIFANQNAYAFDTVVKAAVKIPFDHLHFEFPQRIQGAVIRKSPRIRMRMISTVSPLAQDNGLSDAERYSAIILNVSADGALVQAKQPLAERNSRLRLAFRVNLHDVDTMVAVTAIVRSVFAEENKIGVICHGLQFEEMASNDRLILQSMIYQKMIEQPHLLV